MGLNRITSFPVKLAVVNLSTTEYRGPNYKIVDACPNCNSLYYWENDHYKDVENGQWCSVREIENVPPSGLSKQGRQTRLYICKCRTVIAVEVVDDSGSNIYTASNKEI